MNKVGFFKTIALFFLFVFVPKKFIEEEKKNEKYIESRPEVPEIHRLYILRQALLKSFLFITISGVIGICVGIILSCLYKNPDANIITGLQMTSALILLWATLALRGWDIQSWGGITLTEQINKNIYRFLYLIGTTLFIISMTWE